MKWLTALAVCFCMGGTYAEVLAWDEECAYVPSKTACLSACAMAWFQSPRRVNDGIVGLHVMSGPTPLLNIHAAAETIGWLRDNGLERYIDVILQQTNERVFLLFQGDRVWLQSWKELDGYEIRSSTKGLRCG